jgi:hypothetical protein
VSQKTEKMSQLLKITLCQIQEGGVFCVPFDKKVDKNIMRLQRLPVTWHLLLRLVVKED